MELNLLQAGDRDLEITYQIKRKSLKPYVEQIWGWNEAYQRKIHQDTFNSTNTKLIVVDKKKVGYLVTKENAEEIYLENLLISQEFQNLGIGNKVVKSVIQEAELRDLDIRLQVFKININAQRFYTRLGFVKTGDKENHIEMERKFNTL